VTRNCSKGGIFGPRQGVGREVEVDAVPPGGDVVEVVGPEVRGAERGSDDVDRDDVIGGFVDEVEVEMRVGDEVVRGALVDGAGGSVVEVVRAMVVRGTRLSRFNDCDAVSGRTSTNSTNVTMKIALRITVDLRARPSISERPREARCWSPRRAAG
jgi:hypothetical protein